MFFSRNLFTTAMMHGDELVLLKQTNLMMEISVDLSLVCARLGCQSE